MKLKKLKNNFKWNVWIWNINHRKFESYDVVPMFIMELERLSKNKQPKTKEEFNEFMKREAMYHFWSKCEYEMLLGPLFGTEEGTIKVDIYEQLCLNWDIFVDTFWDKLQGNKKER